MGLLVLAGLLGISQPLPADDGNFVNLSNRGLVGEGDDVRIVGFIIEGGARQVLIQALGPELANRGIANALADPVLTVTQTHEGEPPRTPLASPVELMVNDNWEDSQGQLVSDLWGGSPPLTEGSLSSAVVLTLEPGGYTAKVEGKNGTVGVAIVEVFRIASDSGGTGLAPADQAAFDALFVGKQFGDSNNGLIFLSPGRIREFDGGIAYEGNYEYENTGANTGTLTYTYDVTGNDLAAEKTVIEMTFTSQLAGTFVATYTETGSSPMVTRAPFEFTEATDTMLSFATDSGPGNQSYTVDTAISVLTLPEASGGDGSLTYSLTPSVPGLSFNPNTRRLTGTPTTAGAYSMTYTVTDADGDTDSLTFTITVAAPDTQPSFTAGSGPGDQSYTVDTAISVLTLPEASGGDGALTYSLTPSVPGLSFNPNTRRLTGTPTTAGAHSMTYTVTDADGDFDSLTFTITVAQAPDSVTVLPAEATLAALGDTLGLAAEAFDASGRAVAGAEFSWASSDNAVATVDGSGLVMAVGNGTATITATVGDVGGESAITVAQPNPVSIPDANLRSEIEAALGKVSGAPIYDIEMQTLTSLSAGGPSTIGGGIHDLTGLEYATNLRDLVLHSNTISDLKPLRALTKLQRLNLHAINHYYDDPPPPLDYSPLADLASLTRLDLGFNHTPDISSLAGLTKLTWLNVRNGDVHDISSLAGLLDLEYLNGGRNRIADISVLARLTNLREAILSSNDISDLGPLTASTGLGGGSKVDVRLNPLSSASIRDHVPALQARGVTVLFDDVVVFSDPEIYNDNLFVLPVDGNLASGGWSAVDWTRRFYEHFDDEFDFLVFVVNLYREEHDDPGSTEKSYFIGTHNDVQGIGRRIYSDDRWPTALQGVVVHGTVSFSVDDRSIINHGPMNHELMHRWANFITPSSGSGPHWGFSSANGVLGGFDIAELVHHGDGRYTAGYSFQGGTNGVAANAKPYGPIELYLAGLIPPEEVPDLWVAEDGQWLLDDNGSHVESTNGHWVFTANQIRTYAIDDIVRMHGRRVPDSSHSQRGFRAATILLVDDHHPVTRRILDQLSDDVSWFSHTAADGDDRVYNFFEATGGRATIDMNDLSRSLSQGTRSRTSKTPR